MHACHHPPPTLIQDIQPNKLYSVQQTQCCSVQPQHSPAHFYSPYSSAFWPFHVLSPAYTGARESFTRQLRWAQSTASPVAVSCNKQVRQATACPLRTWIFSKIPIFQVDYCSGGGSAKKLCGRKPGKPGQPRQWAGEANGSPALQLQADALHSEVFVFSVCHECTALPAWPRETTRSPLFATCSPARSPASRHHPTPLSCLASKDILYCTLQPSSSMQ